MSTITGERILCCKCGKRFDERKLQGSWLDRHCPLCGEQLSEQVYDAAARETTDDESLSPKQRNARLKDLAYARYYTSEWFRLSCAGQGSLAADKGRFGLRAFYEQPDCSFCLEPADSDRSPEGGWGASGEYRVFDALRSEIVREGSPLHGARLVSNLTFPWLPGMRPDLWGAKHRAQADCILLTRKCAIIVEVKRKEQSIRVSRDFAHIREINQSGNSKSFSEVIEQVDECKEALLERQKLFRENRVFQLIVFVDSASFTGGTNRFKNRRFVTALGKDGRGKEMVRAIAELLDALKPSVSQKQVDELAERLHNKFGNVQSRREGSIEAWTDAVTNKQPKQADAMLDSLERQLADEGSPLYGARLLRYPVCEIENRKSKKRSGRMTRLGIAGLLLTRSHAVLIDARRMRAHVNTHAPFATFYVGYPKNGAEHIDEDIRHDWDLEAIHYENKSPSIALLRVAARSLPELDRYRSRNRICVLNVFLDPVSYFTNCDDFRSRSFLGYWSTRDNNIIGALERLVDDAASVLSQKQLEKLASELAGE